MTTDAVRFVRRAGRLVVLLLGLSLLSVGETYAQSASTSASSSNVNYGTTISVTGTVSAASGDTLYNNYIWYRRPDGGTGIMWDTYTDYYFQNSRTVTGSITLNQGGIWEFYAYGYTGDAPASQQVIQSQACTVTVNGSPAVANVSVSSSSVSWGSTISVSGSVSAATGDTLYNNFVWYRRPDGSTGIMMDTYVDYYYQNSRSVTGSITLNQSGTWQFYAYGYTGNAPASQQVIESQPANVTVGAQPAPGITSPLAVSVRQRQPLSYQIAASPAVTGFGAAGLPANLSVNPSSGVISGLITGAGSFPSTISATNAVGTTSATLTWNVEAAVITPNGSVYPGAIRQGETITFYRAGSTANFGVAWTENKLWLNGSQVVDLQNQPVGGAPLTWTASASARPDTYYYQLRIADIYYNYADQWIPIQVEPLMHTLPYATSYEQSEGYIVNGNLFPQHGWLVQQGAAHVSSEQPLVGSHGVKLIAGSQRAQVLKAFNPSGARSFVEVYARPVAASVVTDSSAIYYGASRLGFVIVGAGTGAVYAFDGDGNGGGTWVDTGVRFPLNGSNQATQWLRLTVDHDYATHRWQLIVDGTRVRSDLAMRSNTESTFSNLIWWGTTNAAAYVDNFSATVNNPFPPPAIPSGLSASGITDGALTLSWTAPSSPASPVVEYEIQRVGGPTTSSASANLVVNGLYPDTTYSFTIRARNQAGYWSGWSSPYSVRTLPDQTPPSVPTGLTASEPTPLSIRLSWQPSSDNVGVTGYRVTRVGGPVQDTGSTTLVVSGLLPQQNYTFNVQAFDARGNISPVASINVSTPEPDPNADYDNDGVATGIELLLGLNPYTDPNDVRVFNYTYDKANQLKVGPGGEYEKDAEGNIKKVK